MKKVQCVNKHFYDADTYTVCPHCGAVPMDTSAAPQSSGAKPKKGVFKFFGDQNKQTSSKQHDEQLPNRQMTHTENGRNAPEQHQDVSADTGFYESAPQQAEKPQQNVGTLQNQVKMVTTRSLFDINDSNAAQKPQQAPAEQAVPHTMPLQPQKPQQAVLPNPINQQAVNTGTAHSNAAAEKPSAANEGKTIGVFGGKENDDPVVGWLVCLKGSNMGKSYELAARSNTIGRLYGNDVVLENEPQVSRESHAVIEYDYKKSDFYLHKSNGNSPYVNDEIVLTAQKLKRYDKIEIGGCLLLFVPLCGDDFSWNEYIDKE